MEAKEVRVTVLISGDNENSPEEAAHHAMKHLYDQGRIEGWSVDALDGSPDADEDNPARRSALIEVESVLPRKE